MLHKLLLVLTVFVLLGSVTPSIAGECNRADTEKSIINDIATALACEKDDDCSILEINVCPLGCFHAVNKSKADPLKKRIQDYANDKKCDPVCEYKCDAPSSYKSVCKGGKCISQYKTAN